MRGDGHGERVKEGKGNGKWKFTAYHYCIVIIAVC
jgi:hypothetical protein